MRWTLAMILALAAAMPAAAQSGDQGPNMAQRPCTSGETRAATIADISVLGDTAIGQCFSVEAVAVGFWLYADNMARYRRGTADNEPSSSGAVLGLYGRNRGMAPARVRVTGRIDRCERISSAVQSEGGIPFLSGYCHYYRGLALYGRTVEELAPFTFTRIALREAGDLGTLRPLPDGAARQRLLAAAQPFFDALDRRDDATLRSLIIGSRQGQEGEIAALLAHSAVEAWRAGRPQRAVTAIGWHHPADATAEQQAQWARNAADGPEGYVCSASMAFADQGLWPISPGDTDIFAERPYLCVRVWLPANRPPSYTFGLGRPTHIAPREPAP